MIFQFTNKRPDTLIIWRELQKETDFNTEGIDRDLLRTMMWVILSISKDFKKAKDGVNDVLEGNTPIINFRKSFIKSIANSTKFPGLRTNPVDYTKEDTSNFFYDSIDDLREPFFIIKDIFKTSNKNALVAMLQELIPNISDTLLDHVIIDMLNYQSGNAWTEFNQTYVSISRNLEINTENMFQKVLKIDINAEPMITSAVDEVTLFNDIKQYVLESFSHSPIQQLPITIPKIVKTPVEGNYNEAQ